MTKVMVVTDKNFTVDFGPASGCNDGMLEKMVIYLKDYHGDLAELRGACTA